MRILAIRGRNLASLAEQFDVDFRLEPLASAGLFAITGATGAGKSTLLDALCLALYDGTPRLARATGKGINLPDVRDETIAPGDPRSILRRGAAEGFAEVDFVGNDGVGYRARWNVRRARNKPDGKLQPSEMSLIRIADDHPMAGNLKTEVLPEIQRRIGLNFAQFTRAVLLAQNDFAAFLKATDDERAELLQTLTGTDLFSDISRRAFERNKAERERLQRQQEQLADQKPLDGDARAALEIERTRLQHGLQVLEGRKAEVEGHLRWHSAWEQAKQAEIGARAVLDKALADKSVAQERTAAFARVEAVQSARPLVADLDRLAVELAGASKARVEAEGGLTKAKQEREKIEGLLREAGERLQGAERAKGSATPDLVQARELDTQIRLMEPHLASARRALDEAKAGLEKTQGNHRTKAEEARQVEVALAANRQWLSDNGGLQALAEGWIRWETLFDQAAAALGELARIQKESAALGTAAEAKEQALATAKKQQAEIAKTLAAAQAALDAAGRKCAEFDPDGLDKRKKALEGHRDLVTAGEKLWQDIAARQGSHNLLTAKAKELARGIEESRQALAQARTRKPQVEREAAQAERSLRIAEAACHESVETLRSSLEDDTPCPVCGSLSHPYATDNPQLRAVLDGLRLEAEGCRQLLGELTRQEASHASLLASGEKQLGEVRLELGVLEEELARYRQAWREHPLSGELNGNSDEAQLDWLAGQLEAIQGQLAALGREEAACRDALRQRESARQAVEAARQADSKAREEAAAAELAHQQALQAAQAATGKGADLEKALESLLAALDTPFPNSDWQDPWLRNPLAFVAARKREAEAWNNRAKERTELEARGAALAIELKSLAQASTAADDSLKRVQEDFAAIESSFKNQQEKRQNLFEGRPVAEVESNLDRAIETAKKALAEQQEGVRRTMTEEERAAEAFRQAKVQEEKRQSDSARVQADLAAWLADFNGRNGSGLNAEELRLLLTRDRAWIQAEREALQALDTAIETAKAVFKERQFARESHEQARGTPESAEALGETLGLVMKELETARAKATAVDIELGKDDERRQRSAVLLQDIERQEAKARVWAQLNELIGSADGKKFRNFAQQMTLDVLLGYANRHLERLSRRYRLERIPESLALLVVDQDMGGEIRSVHSLSGGESFLLSLALALGLASLSSHQVRVESLFIDEGFGSLDGEALRVAMEALDSLQAQGRKVGVISHVQEMTERISTQIQVRRLAGGQSRLTINDA